MSALAASPTAAEMIEEYEKIVRFSEDVLAGRHPRVKINVPPILPAPAPPAGSAINIDFRANYYKDLGVNANVKHDGLARAYAHKMSLYAPESEGGKPKWVSESKNVRDRVQDGYYRAKKAYEVLSNTTTRRQYNAGRIVPSSTPRTTTTSSVVAVSDTVNASMPVLGMAGMSWAEQAKLLEEHKQIEDKDDGEASDADSTRGLYWGAKGKNE